MDSAIARHLVNALLPPEIAVPINTHLFNPQSPFQAWKRQIFSYVSQFFVILRPVAQPLIDRLFLLTAENQGAASLLTLAIVVTVVFLVISWVQRVIMFWTRLAMRAVFWALVAAVAAWVWQRGLYLSFVDAWRIGWQVWAWGASQKRVWDSEYERYSSQGTGSGSGSGSGQPQRYGGGRYDTGRGGSSWR